MESEPLTPFESFDTLQITGTFRFQCRRDSVVKPIRINNIDLTFKIWWKCPGSELKFRDIVRGIGRLKHLYTKAGEILPIVKRKNCRELNHGQKEGKGMVERCRTRSKQSSRRWTKSWTSTGERLTAERVA